MRTVLILLLFASMSAPVHAQSKRDRCTVWSTWWSPKARLGGGSFKLGEFYAAENEANPTRSFRQDELKLFVIVGVDYERDPAMKKPLARLALRISDRAIQDLFWQDTTSHAEVSWDQHSRLSVSQSQQIGELAYTFTLTCEASAAPRPRKSK